MFKRLATLAGLVLPFTVLACSEDEATSPIGTPDSPQLSSAQVSNGDEIEAGLLDMMDQANAYFEAEGADFRIGMVEYLTESGEQGRTVFFRNVGNKQLIFDFVPNDARRAGWSGPAGGPGDDITWASDLPDGDAGLGLGPTQTAIANAMATWNGVKCSAIPLTNVPAGGDLGVLQFLLAPFVPPFGPPGSAGGSPVPVADATHAGFGTIVDFILPPPVIAAAFTAFFPTDVDNNGKIDAAFREIYYTFNFPWGINTNFPIDVETVALHEFGHGLSQAHFGKLFRTDANLKFHFAPRAVMNAGYTGIQQSLSGSDNGGHCSNWASWPNN